MPYVGTYRTRSGRYYFRWSFEQQPNGEVRAYIVHAPGYGQIVQEGIGEVGQDGERLYIAFEPMPLNLEEAIEIAKQWAERADTYIAISGEFCT